MANIPITPGSGGASVATETVSGLNYQQIQVYGGGGSSILGINPDRSINTSIIGVPNVNVSGSVVASGTIGASVIGHAPVVIVGGSVIATVTAVPNQSVSGTVQADVRGSVATVIIGGSIAASFTPPANQSVSGTVGASIIGTVPVTQSGTQITSLVSIVPSSVIVGASIFGQLPAGSAMIGSVVGYQGVVPWIVNFQNSSIIGINAGSVVALSQGSVIVVRQNPSIVGTYVEDAAHATGDRGLFVLGVRNDTMASITSADGDYSAMAQGPVGETIVANAPITRWVQGTADLRGLGSTGVSVIAIASGGSSVFTYITGVQIANMGSASVLVTLASGGSILGYSIAPAGGGSNIVYRNALKTPGNFGFAASISGVASVLVSAQGFTSRT